jgi:hypothetical protein
MEIICIYVFLGIACLTIHLGITCVSMLRGVACVIAITKITYLLDCFVSIYDGLQDCISK